MSTPATPGFTDWIAPTSQVEKVVTISAGVTLIPNGAALTVDSSRYLSMDFAFTLPNPATVKRYSVTMQWISGTDLLGQDAISFHGGPIPNTYPLALRWQLPVRGPSCVITATGDDNTAVIGALYGSTRAITGIHIANDVNGAGGLLSLTTTAVLIPGATSAIIYAPPVSRTTRARVNLAIATLQMNVSGIWVRGGVMAALGFGSYLSSASLPASQELVAPGIGMEWTIVNNDAANRQPTLVLWDVS